MEVEAGLSAAPKILIVDDRPENIFAMEMMLSPLGVRLLSAQSGNEALALLLHHDFALALLDVQMPEMDGFELAELMREHEETAQIPIIFVTALSKEERYVFKGYATGAVDYIFKPIDMEILRSKVRIFCQLYQQQELLKEEIEQRRQAVAALEEKQQELKEENRKREEAEKHAQESALRYRSLAELSPLGILTQIKGVLSYVNTATLKLLGASARDEVLGKAIEDFVAPEMREEIGGYLDNVMRQGGHLEGIELELLRIDGEKRTIALHGACFFVEGEIGIQLALQDISRRKQLEEELRALSQIDGLTGIANRRFFDEIFRRESLRSRRTKTPLSLIMVDIDFFKAFNDNYGHQEGDAVLREVAQALKHATKRATDLVARYGGEEFVVILPETAAEGAFVVAERMRKAVQSLAIAHAHSSSASHVSISLGFATTQTEAGEGEALVAQADSALYQAKKSGRNQVCAYAPEKLEAGERS